MTATNVFKFRWFQVESPLKWEEEVDMLSGRKMCSVGGGTGEGCVELGGGIGEDVFSGRRNR